MPGVARQVSPSQHATTMSAGQHQQRYRVIDKLASGGMAEVFRAESAGIEGFKKKVAIKRVLPHLSKKRKFIQMFLDEARLSAHLSHSNVVQVFDIGIGDDTYFIVMEYVDGADLKAIIETRRQRSQEFPLEAGVYVTTKICEGLAYAHELKDGDGNPFGIVHRDMSPPNVLITRYGEVKIADFGLAKANNQLEKSEPGIIKGKFSYLSPEAATGQEVDARADIFAVGIILWEILAGRKLFLGESDYETVKLVQQAQIPPLTQFNKKVPPSLERTILRALARNPAERYQRASDLARDLNAFLYHHGRPVGPWDVAALVNETITQRQHDKPTRGAAMIEQMIADALFEFTSLQEHGQDSASGHDRRSTPTGSPLPIDLGGIGARDWESEIVIKNPYGAPRIPETDQRILSSLEELEAGNLSSLEDDPVPIPRSAEPATRAESERVPTPATAPQGQQAPAVSAAAYPARPGASAPGLEAVAPEPRKSRSTGIIVLLVVILVGVAGAAGAWLANTLPR